MRTVCLNSQETCCYDEGCCRFPFSPVVVVAFVPVDVGPPKIIQAIPLVSHASKSIAVHSKAALDSNRYITNEEVYSFLFLPSLHLR